MLKNIKKTPTQQISVVIIYPLTQLLPREGEEQYERANEASRKSIQSLIKFHQSKFRLLCGNQCMKDKQKGWTLYMSNIVLNPSHLYPFRDSGRKTEYQEKIDLGLANWKLSLMWDSNPGWWEVLLSCIS